MAKRGPQKKKATAVQLTLWNMKRDPYHERQPRQLNLFHHIHKPHNPRTYKQIPPPTSDKQSDWEDWMRKSGLAMGQGDHSWLGYCGKYTDEDFTN